jgi:hypothetical protein
MKVRSIKMTKEQQEALRSAAEAKGVSDSFLVREALEAYLAGPMKGTRSRSAADAASHLIGSLDGTPRDLSSNPKYLAGYGK